MPSRKQWNRILRYIVETGSATYEEMYVDSTMCGNYRNNPEGLHGHIAKTGSNTYWMYNGIDNLCGNTTCWTREKKEWSKCAIRGGGFHYSGDGSSASYRHGNYSTTGTVVSLGFRVVLDRKHCELN